MSDAWSAQRRPALRLAVLRRMLGAVIAVLLTFGPYDLSSLEAVLYQGPLPLGAAGPPLRWLSVLLGILLLVGPPSRVVALALSVTFGVFNAYAAGFGPMWSYNTHLHTFLLALVFAGRDVTSARAALILTLLQLDVGLLYFQAGVSKLLDGGVAWFTTGSTAAGFVALHGTPFGRALFAHPAAAPLVGLATGAFELGFLPLLAAARLRRWLGAAGICFHLGAWATLGISFWHLWVLFVPLFLMDIPPARQTG